MGTALARRLDQLTTSLDLTQDDVASILGTSSRSVSRWATEGVAPQRLTRQRLMELGYVAELVAEVMKPSDAHLWLMSPNRLLGHDSPADRIRTGDFRTVVGLLEALADGIVV